MKKAFFIFIVMVFATALYFSFTASAVEVRPFNQSPAQAGDYNLSILSKEKQDKQYAWRVVIRGKSFRGVEYVAAFPQDAVTVTSDESAETLVQIYTDNPDASRLKSFM